MATVGKLLLGAALAGTALALAARGLPVAWAALGALTWDVRLLVLAGALMAVAFVGESVSWRRPTSSLRDAARAAAGAARR